MKSKRILPRLPGAHPIDRKIFGSFIEHIENCIDGGIWDRDSQRSNARGIRQDVQELCRKLGPSILRFPGGTVVGIYHWQDHVGPAETRRAMRNLVWGGMLTEAFGTCEFIEYCRELGAEPMLCVNMPSGTPEEAAHWVEYCNGTGHSYYADLRRSHGYEEPFRVRYWCIGNESFSEPDLGMQDDVKNYVREAWEYAKYMKMTDPDIELIFSGNTGDMAWNRMILDSLGDVCDYLSLHFYAHSEDAFDQLSRFESETLTTAERMLAEYNGRESSISRWYRIPSRKHPIFLALDEWNIWDGTADSRSLYGLQQRYSWQNALWIASFLNMLIRRGDVIRIANLAQMVNVLAPVIAEKDAVWTQTLFEPFALYSHCCGDVRIPCEEEESSGGDTALTRGEKEWILFAVNREAEELKLQLPFSASRGILLTAEDPGVINTREKNHVRIREAAMDSAMEIVLEPWSIGCIFMPYTEETGDCR